MFRICLIAGLAAVLTACGQGTPSDSTTEAAAMPLPVATKVFSGGTIYTGVGTDTVDALAIDRNQRIIWTGAAGDLAAEVDTASAETISLDGAVMYPGFTDGHAHLLGIGQRAMTLNLEGTASIAELRSRIEAEIARLEPGAVLFGRGWIETGWPERRMPVAADIDAVSPGNPVILVRADGHALLANSKALELAWINRATIDVEGGKIERDAAGNPTGLLIDKAMGAAMALVAQPDEAELAAAFAVGAETYVRRGWTGVHNMSVARGHARVLERLDLEGRMPLRLYNAYNNDGFVIAASRTAETDTITNRAVKLYMDGALGSRGALLIEPYSDRPQTSGLSLTDPETLKTIMWRAERDKVQLAIHAIGDLANRHILDVFEANGYGSEKRWRIEHTQVLHPDDIARVGTLGLIASMQPSHAIGDLKFAPDRLGLERLKGAYAWQSLLANNAMIVGGSDAPVEVGSPQIEFYAAVARKDLEGFSAEGWHPEEALTREQALALFTSAPAYAAFMEKDLGTIEVGKLADFTVFDRDIMTVPEAEILDAEVVMTIVHGEIEYQSAE